VRNHRETIYLEVIKIINLNNYYDITVHVAATAIILPCIVVEYEISRDFFLSTLMKLIILNFAYKPCMKNFNPVLYQLKSRYTNLDILKHNLLKLKAFPWWTIIFSYSFSCFLFVQILIVLLNLKSAVFTGQYSI